MISSSGIASSDVTPSSIPATSNCCEGDNAGSCEYECTPFGTGFLNSGDCSTKFPPTPYPVGCGGEEDPCEPCECLEDGVSCPGGVSSGQIFFTVCWIPTASGLTPCP